MAAVDSEQVTPGPSKESFNEVFAPKDTIDHPCDVVLVVENGKQFKAHRKVLSEATPFFEKLLSSDMKESKEGVVRLEMFSESVMAATLEFIYTGHVQILAADYAQDLIVMADYLLLPKLKSLAEGVLAQMLNASNCISSYYLSQIYRSEDLHSKTKKFILANFTAAYTANPEDVLNMSSKEVEIWISSDEIDVSAEEDVFNFLLAWIDHDKNKRKEYFGELFSHVRLVYVSRDFLISDVVTNDLVKENESCLDLVKGALDLIDSKNCDDHSVPARKSLETPAIVMRRVADFLCYFPDEDSFYKLAEIPSEFSSFDNFFPCKGKWYTTKVRLSLNIMVSYNPYTNSWMKLPPLENRYFKRIFVGNWDEMYALVSCECFPWRHMGVPCGWDHGLFISKYKPESHSWDDIAAVDHLHRNGRLDYCIVVSDHLIYFIGGVRFVQAGERLARLTSLCFERDRYAHLTGDVDRYDLSKNQWDKVADIQVARRDAKGVAVNGKVFIAGGYHKRGRPRQCEVYDERTNVWQIIASLEKPEAFDTLLASDGKLYAISYTNNYRCFDDSHLQQISVECYNPENNEWEMKTEMEFPVERCFLTPANVSACSMRIFKGLSKNRPLETSTSDSLPQNRKCFIM